LTNVTNVKNVKNVTNEQDVLSRIEQLQNRYIRALDDRNMRAWLDTFTLGAEAAYICTNRESVEGNLPVAMILDDSRARLEDRVTFITKVWDGSFQDYRMRHFVQRLEHAEEGRLWRVRSNFRVVCTPIGRNQRVESVVGVYEDLVDCSGESAVFVSRKAIVDDSVFPRYLVYPI